MLSGPQASEISYFARTLLGLAIIFSTTKFPRRAKRLSPNTFGHLQTIVDLVDEWPEKLETKMYWGHKTCAEAVNHAGMSTEKTSIKSVKADVEYGGERCKGCFSES